MLEILEANPTGFFSYGKHHTIQIPQNEIIELTGWNSDRTTQTANGAGKSSFLNTVCHILYGEDPSGASDTDVVNSVWNKGCWGYLKFKIRSEFYRIFMVRKWTQDAPDIMAATQPSEVTDRGEKYRGTDIFFEHLVGGTWRDLRKAKMVETRAKILSTLEMSYDQFLTTSYLAQQKTSKFITGKNKDRMQVISEMMDLSVWDKAKAIASKRLQTAQQQLTSTENIIIGQTGALELIKILDDDQVFKIYGEIDITASALSTIDNELLEVKLNIDSTTQNIKTLKEVLATETVEYVRLNNIYVKIGEEAKALAREEEVALGILRIENTTKEIEEFKIEKMTELKAVQSRLSKAITGAGECDKCGSVISKDAVDSLRLSLEDQIKALKEYVLVLDRQITANKQAEIERLEILKSNVKKLYETKMDVVVQQLQKALVASSTIAAKCRELQVEIQRIEAQKQMLWEKNEGLNRQRGPLMATVQRLESILSNQEQLIAQRTALMSKIELLQQQAKVEQAEIIAIEAVVRNMGDKGIKAHKFGSLIETLNMFVSEYIGIVAESQVQVWFSPWRESAKSADEMVAEVQIFVREGPKEAVELNLYSGAERQQITLAIVCAFWRLATLNGMGSSVLLLDEIFGMFDGPTASLAVRLLVNIRAQHKGCIIVITHDPRIRDMLPFDRVWTAAKTNHISTIKESKSV